MAYLMTRGSSRGPYCEEVDYWQEEWGSQYQAMLPRWQGYEIDPQFLPDQMYVTGGRRVFPPFLMHPEFMCADDVIAVIEKLDPGIHRFHPVEILKDKKSDEVVAKYNLITVCQPLDSFIPEQSNPRHIQRVKINNPQVQRYNFDLNLIRWDVEKEGVDAGIALDPDRYRGRHIWREKKISRGIYVSDEMREALRPFCEKNFIEFTKLTDSSILKSEFGCMSAQATHSCPASIQN